jgi:hypothetical protein
MSVVTEILSLRQDRISRVPRLLAALDWQKSAYEKDRGVAVTEAADLVLVNVAAHCAEIMVCRRYRLGAFLQIGHV